MSKVLDPTFTVTAPVSTFVIKAYTLANGANLIFNGNFEQGNVGFTSGGNYSPGDLSQPLTYDVLANPQDDNPIYSNCTDHTTGNGNMMAVHPPPSKGMSVWCQTVAVEPNTVYSLSFWATRIGPGVFNDNKYQLYMNGVLVTSSVPGGLCSWKEIKATWNSGSNTTVEMCIDLVSAFPNFPNKPLQPFALDDITMRAPCTVYDSVKVYVKQLTIAPSVIATVPCAGSPITLNATNGTTLGDFISFAWSTPDGNFVSGENTLKPTIDEAGSYVLSLKYQSSTHTCEREAEFFAKEAPPLFAHIVPLLQLSCLTPKATLKSIVNYPQDILYSWSTENGGHIVSGETEASAVVDQPGHYTLLVTNAKTGCTATAEYTVNPPEPPPVADATASSITCTQPLSTLSGAGSSSTGPLVYIWSTSNGSISSDPKKMNATASKPGTYILQVLSGNGCKSYDTVQVLSDLVKPTLALATPKVLECKPDTVALSATIAPANAALAWVASNGGNIVSGANSHNPQVNTSGTYTLTATHPVNGCTSTSAVSVQNTVQLVATAAPPKVLTCLSPTLTLDATGSSAGPDIEYLWTTTDGVIQNGETSLSPLIAAPGAYHLKVSDKQSGCAQNLDIAVLADKTPPQVEAALAPALNCSVPNADLTALRLDTLPNVAFEWTTTDGKILSGASTLLPNIGAGGTYVLTATNLDNGCSASLTFPISADFQAPTLQIAPTQALTCLVPSLQITASASSASNQLAYAWTTSNGGNILEGDHTSSPKVDQPGTYTLLVTDLNNGCTNSNSVVVDLSKTPPTLDVAPAGPLTCTTTSLDLSATTTGSNLQYAWTAGNGGNLVSGSNTASPKVDRPGAYTLTVTDLQNGCTATDEVIVLSNTLAPEAHAGAPVTLTCTTASTALSGSGSLGAPFSYLWTTLNGNIVTGENTLTPTVNAAGDYQLLVTDHLNGCTATDQVSVQKDANVPAAQIQTPGTLTCVDKTVQLNALGSSQGANIQFIWTTSNGHFSQGQNTLTPSVDAPGEYTLQVLNTVSNCTVSTVVTVPENLIAPLAQVAAPAVINCLNAQVTLDAGASSQGSNYTLLWTPSNGGNIVSGATTLTPTVNKPGTYALLITDPTNGCTAAASVAVAAYTTPPLADAGPPALLTCAHATSQLQGTGSAGTSFLYEWTTADGYISSGANTLTPTVSAAGTYILQVTDIQNGCTASDLVLIQKDANLPVAMAQTPGLLTCKVAVLQLTANGSAQGADFTYLWTTTTGNIVSDKTTLTPTVDKPGVYTLLVSNTINNCSATASVTVLDDHTAPAAAANAPGVINCKSSSVTLSGNGATQGAHIAYQWTSDASGHLVSGNSTLAPMVDQPGLYTLLVTNTENGCTATAATTVLMDKSAPTVQTEPVPQLNCQLGSLQLQGTAQGANLIYSWIAANGGNIVSGNNTLIPIIDQPGAYELLVTNTQNGCTAATSIVVSRDITLPIAAVTPPHPLNCAVSTLHLDAGNSSQGAAFTYDWTATNGGNIVSGDKTLTPWVGKPGTYGLLITNTLNHCTATATTLVTQNIAPPEVSTGTPLILNCSTTALSLSATVTGAGNNFESAWTTNDGLLLTGENTLTPTVGAAGTYTILVKNVQNGCTQTATAQVLKDANAPLSTASAPDELTCKTTQVQLNGSGSSTGNGITYAWTTVSGSIVSGNTTLSPTVSKPGTYTLLVTNPANHCTATSTVTVPQNIQPPQADAGASSLLTCTVQQTSLAGIGTGGIQGVSYAWSGPGIVSGANTPSPTTNAAGIFTLTVTDQYNGCTATSQTNVGQDVTPPVGLIAPPSVLNCQDKIVSLNGTISTPVSGYSVSWVGAGILSGGNTLTPAVGQPGVYTLQVSNTINGCTSSISTSVTQNITPPKAEANLGFELNCTVVQGGLSAAGSSTGAPFQYAWAATGGGNIVSGSNSPTPLVNAAGEYVLTVTDLQNHCTATDAVQVTQNTNLPTGLKLEQQPPTCKLPTGSVHVTAVLGGEGPYLYSLDGGASFGPVSQFSKVAPGAYTLVIQDANGCEYEQPLVFNAPIQPTIALGPDVHLVFGEDKKLTATVNLPPSQIASISWSPMEGLTPTTDPLVVIAHPLKSTYYTVKVVNTDGCEAKVSLRTQVDEPHIWAPNVFSPRRRDGSNDFFLLFASDHSVEKIRTFQIFDRWGSMVFRNDDLLPNVEKMGWDGSFRGRTVQPAVFVWYAEVLLANGELVLMKGDVTVVD